MDVKATIVDVSRLSGVSTATVSRAFSSPDQVRQETRQKVFDAARALNYTPNAIARDMATQRTNRIAYIICKRRATILDEFYAGICEGIMRRANSLNLQLMISTAEDWRAMPGSSQVKQIEGAILGGDAEAGMVSELLGRGVSVVLVNNAMPGFELPSVVADEAGGVRQAVEHLIGRGHTRIGMLVGRFSPYIVNSRHSAFMETMRLHRLPVRPSDVVLCERTLESALEVSTKLLSLPDRPTALFGANDLVASGAHKAAVRLGLRIPEDLAIVGYDDSTACRLLEPELTSVRVDVRSMGEKCVDLLRGALEHREETEKRIVVPTKLVVRQSS